VLVVLLAIGTSATNSTQTTKYENEPLLEQQYEQHQQNQQVQPIEHQDKFSSSSFHSRPIDVSASSAVTDHSSVTDCVVPYLSPLNTIAQNLQFLPELSYLSLNLPFWKAAFNTLNSTNAKLTFFAPTSPAIEMFNEK
jgi:hypothetical protein